MIYRIAKSFNGSHSHVVCLWSKPFYPHFIHPVALLCHWAKILGLMDGTVHQCTPRGFPARPKTLTLKPFTGLPFFFWPLKTPADPARCSPARMLTLHKTFKGSHVTFNPWRFRGWWFGAIEKVSLSTLLFACWVSIESCYGDLFDQKFPLNHPNAYIKI